MSENDKRKEHAEYPEGFVEACSKVYQEIGPLAFAVERLGCWVFETPEVLFISGPMAVKIDTGEVLHFHIPALITDKEYAEEIAGKLGVTVKQLMDAMVDGDELEEDALPRIEVPEEFKQRPAYWDSLGNE